jgi:Mg2+ and Co2+ transporter CorA
MIDTITDVICDFLDVERHQVRGKTRTQNVVEARIMMCAVLQKMKPYLTLTKVGAIVNRDHSLVIHYRKRHEALMEFNKDYERQFRAVCNTVAAEIGIGYGDMPLDELKRLRGEYEAKVNEINNFIKLREV